MKIMKTIIVSMFLIALMSMSIYALDRVVCEVEVLSDQSATVHLKWQNSSKEGIRITGWTLIDEHTLKITYQTGTNMEPGWDTRKIEGEGYDFPMKIILQKENEVGATFIDLPTSEEQKYSILNLYYRGIIAGYSDGSFKPNNKVTRTEFAKMITEAAAYSLSQASTTPFKDVSSSYWGRPYIMTLAEKEILKGKANGIFDPKGNITIGEILAVINRTFIFYKQEQVVTYPYGLKQHWSNDDFTLLVEVGMIKSRDQFYNPYTPDAQATRVQCAVLLSRVLEQLYETK